MPAHRSFQATPAMYAASCTNNTVHEPNSCNGSLRGMHGSRSALFKVSYDHPPWLNTQQLRGDTLAPSHQQLRHACGWLSSAAAIALLRACRPHTPSRTCCHTAAYCIRQDPSMQQPKARRLDNRKPNNRLTYPILSHNTKNNSSQARGPSKLPADGMPLCTAARNASSHF
jgi:hypothetical protein